MHFILHVITNRALGANATTFALLFAELLAILIIPSILIKKKGRPISALAWLLTVLSIPYVGVLLWWTLGRNHLKRVQRFNRFRDKSVPQYNSENTEPSMLDKLVRHRLDFNRRGIFRPTRNNHIDVYSSGPEYFSEFKASISSAKNEILLLYYIWKCDETGKEIRDLLIQKSNEGVKVRVIVDNFGSLAFLGSFSKPLRDAGVEVSGFLPPRFWPWAPTFNFRNHRKLLCIDGTTSFLGGINIGNEYKYDWRDVAIKITGPASQQLEKVFLEDWAFSTKQIVKPTSVESRLESGSDECTVVASGPDCDLNCSLEILFQLISIAKERVWIQTPYFVPPSSICAALRAAVQRGVDVRIMLPQKNDVYLVGLASRSYYESLLDSGVSIFEYTKEFLHSKTAIVDDYTLIGSSNIDSRSFQLNFELGGIVRSTHIVNKFESIFAVDLSNSIQIDKSTLNSSKWSKLKESFAHLLSPLI